MNTLPMIFLITVMMIMLIATCDGNRRHEEESIVYDDPDVPRVQIKVFRGSDDGLNNGNVVSWGYYVSQPSDG